MLEIFCSFLGWVCGFCEALGIPVLRTLDGLRRFDCHVFD